VRRKETALVRVLCSSAIGRLLPNGRFDMPNQLQGKSLLIAGPTCPLIPTLISCLSAEGAAVQYNELEADGCAEGLGRIDVLLNVIPAIPVEAFFDLSQTEWERSLSATLSNAFRWSQAVGRRMSLSGSRGIIINILSERDAGQDEVSPFVPMIRRGCTIAFTQALAAELTGRPIQVNAIVAHAAGHERLTPAEAFEDVVRTTLFLCAAHGTSVSGESVYLGGSAGICSTASLHEQAS
jgi:NAD(P)-dependent dehydrogenase (short-subunit alcohol dehydrogenase family)